jgi:hypothetical protein
MILEAVAVLAALEQVRVYLLRLVLHIPLLLVAAVMAVLVEAGPEFLVLILFLVILQMQSPQQVVVVAEKQTLSDQMEDLVVVAVVEMAPPVGLEIRQAPLHRKGTMAEMR